MTKKQGPNGSNKKGASTPNKKNKTTSRARNTWLPSEMAIGVALFFLYKMVVLLLKETGRYDDVKMKAFRSYILHHFTIFAERESTNAISMVWECAKNFPSSPADILTCKFNNAHHKKVYETYLDILKFFR